VDAGISTRVLVSGAGLCMFVPVGLWAWAMRLMRRKDVERVAA